MAHSFIELHKPLHHDKVVIHEGEWNIIQLQKGMKYWCTLRWTYRWMNKGWKHYAKWKHRVTKDHILYGSIYMKGAKQENPQRQKAD